MQRRGGLNLPSSPTPPRGSPVPSERGEGSVAGTSPVSSHPLSPLRRAGYPLGGGQGVRANVGDSPVPSYRYLPLSATAVGEEWGDASRRHSIERRFRQ